jgi:hypothetical protein
METTDAELIRISDAVWQVLKPYEEKMFGTGSEQ